MVANSLGHNTALELIVFHHSISFLIVHSSKSFLLDPMHLLADDMVWCPKFVSFTRWRLTRTYFQTSENLSFCKSLGIMLSPFVHTITIRNLLFI